MIPQSEIRRRSRSLGVQETHILGDYALNHVLVSVSHSFPELIFRGGTALARVYWPDFRLSEDLDFIAEAEVADLQERLESSINDASKRINRPLDFRFGGPKDDRSRSTVASEFGEFLIDINLLEKAYLPVEDEVPLSPAARVFEGGQAAPRQMGAPTAPSTLRASISRRGNSRRGESLRVLVILEGGFLETCPIPGGRLPMLLADDIVRQERVSLHYRIGRVPRSWRSDSRSPPFRGTRERTIL